MAPLPFSVELALRAHGLGLPSGSRAVDVLRHRVGGQVAAELRWQHEHGDDLVRLAAKELLEDGPSWAVQPVRIEVLGCSQVLIDGRPSESPSARRGRVRQLLALLAVEPRLRRDRAMALLWPDLDQTAASRNLRVTLTYLRQLFREPGAGRAVTEPPLDEGFLLVDSTSIRLVTYPGLDVDLWQLDVHLTAAAQALAAGDLRTYSDELGNIAVLWQSEPLTDLDGIEEMSGEMSRVRTALIDSTLAFGEIRLSEGRLAESVRHAHAVLAVDPFIERAHRLAIAAQIQLGDHRAAREAAQRMDDAFAEVGAVPDETTQILLRRFATMTPGPR